MMNPEMTKKIVTPLPPGVYQTDQDMRALVHNLEHGYVVILYKGIPADQVDQLRQFVEARDTTPPCVRRTPRSPEPRPCRAASGLLICIREFR